MASPLNYPTKMTNRELAIYGAIYKLWGPAAAAKHIDSLRRPRPAIAGWQRAGLAGAFVALCALAGWIAGGLRF
jgi:hypothetical protein